MQNKKTERFFSLFLISKQYFTLGGEKYTYIHSRNYFSTLKLKKMKNENL